MMRAILEEKIAATFSDEERAQLLSLISPKNAAELRSSYEARPKSARKR
jgi:hypothetical protein